ncbi:MAG: acetyl-CoA hydrolase/transferase C-terminal domain-containing protein [Caldisericia bacterium]|jgi:acyl-CoA hydrolase|nr:acetyl-CoA hydrolase/transferase C-terminal domain-containing protein [Caldisericia bacterium]
MNKIDDYKRKLISIDELLNKIKDNETIVVALGGSQPFGFLSSLHKIKDRVKNVKIISCLLLKDYEFLKYTGKENAPFILESWYLSDFERKVYNEGRATYIPNNLHRAAIEKIANEKIDYFIGTATPMDEKGFFSLSLSLIYEKEMIENARIKVLEINENLPKTFGDTSVFIDEIDYVTHYTTTLPEFPFVEPTDIERKIGEYISDLIEDGSTIQLGIGGIPNAITKFLMNKKNLGIHTEMITDGMVDLIESGVVTNREKTLWKGKTIGAFALGTKKLYDFINNNLSVELHRGSVVNDPYVVRQNNKMVSINTSLMVDLTGQVCSESFGWKQYTGTGGQLDMHRGAQMSKGGKGIIALRSTAKGGEVSTIVPVLPEGSYITVPRQDTDYIVTEYGVAKLKGKSIRERALSLINIAHPDFRDKLMFEAKKLNLI